jgi:protein HIRA/HIR1
LYAVSEDGTMGVFAFEADELGGIASYEDQKDYLRRYNYVPPDLPRDFVHSDLLPAASSTKPAKALTASGPSQGEVVNTLVAKRKDKRAGPRRVNLMSSIPSASTSSNSNAFTPSRTNGHSGSLSASASTARPTSSSSRMPASTSFQRPAASTSHPMGITTDGFGFDDVPMDEGRDGVASFAALETSSSQARRRSPNDVFGDEARLKARTLGGDRQRETVPVRELVGTSQQPLVATEALQIGQTILSALPVLTVVSARIGQGTAECILEGKNAESGCAWLRPSDAQLLIHLQPRARLHTIQANKLSGWTMCIRRSPRSLPHRSSTRLQCKMALSTSTVLLAGGSCRRSYLARLARICAPAKECCVL